MGVERRGGIDPSFLSRAKQRWLEAATSAVHGRAVSNAPVRSGYLKGSIDKRVLTDQGTVFTPVHYAPHVEYGTIHMAAQPFLRPALDTSRGDLMRLWQRYLREEL